jgi:hypothetical protein
MGNGLIRFPWIPGPAVATRGAVLVSITDFRLDRARDLPGAYWAGARLRHAWPGLEGAVGQWLWARPLTKRSGAVSIWRSEEDLLRFVRWPVHVEIMHKYRNAGKLVSASWETDQFLPDIVWAQAVRRLASAELS